MKLMSLLSEQRCVCLSPLAPAPGERARERGRALQAALQFVVLLTANFLANGDLLAQNTSPDADVRQTSNEILAEPEFRYFDHLGDSPDRPRTRFERQRVSFSPSGDGGSGKSGNGKEGSGGPGQEGRDRQSRGRANKKAGDNAASDADGGSDSSSTSIPLGGGLGAVGGVFGAIFHVLAYLILIAVCVLIIFLVVRAIMTREPAAATLTSTRMNFDVPVEEDHSPGELPADAYLAKARELAAQRRYREAISYLLLGGMSAIERAQLIRHRRGLTLRDYLRSLRGKAPQYDGFKSMIGLYEPVGFGRRVASQITFDDALEGYEQAVEPLGAPS